MTSFEKCRLAECIQPVAAVIVVVVVVVVAVVVVVVVVVVVIVFVSDPCKDQDYTGFSSEILI